MLNAHIRLYNDHPLKVAVQKDDVDEFLVRADPRESHARKEQWAKWCIDFVAPKCFEALYRIDDWYLEDAYSQNSWRLVQIVRKRPTMDLAKMFITCLQMGANLAIQWDTRYLLDNAMSRNYATLLRPLMTLQAFLCLDERGWQPLWDLWITWTLSIHDQLACFPTPLAALIHDYILQ